MPTDPAHPIDPVEARQRVQVTFTLEEWDRIVKRADVLMKQSNGHSFVISLKTRCQYCGRSPRARGKCPAWPTTFAARILFVLMNKDQELRQAAPATTHPKIGWPGW